MKRAALLLGMLSLSGLWTGPASAQYLETIRIRAIYADPRDYVVETDRREVVSLRRGQLVRYCGSPFYTIERWRMPDGSPRENFRELVELVLTAFRTGRRISFFTAPECRTNMGDGRAQVTHGFIAR